VQTPTNDHATGDYPSHFTVTLACSTSGATIKYSLVAFNAAPGTYVTYTAPFGVSVYSLTKKTLYVYAIKAGLLDSNVVRYDYWLESNL
jgi:hypothetical protein